MQAAPTCRFGGTLVVRIALAAVCLLTVAAFSLTATDAHAVTAAEKQAEAQATLATLNSLSAELDQKSDAYHAALAAQEEAQAKMDEAQARIDEANERIAYLQNHLSTRARAMYRNGAISMLDILMGASSFSDFATTWDLLSQMNDDDAAAVHETKDLRAEVEEQHAVYAEQEALAAAKTAEAEQIMKEAQDLVNATRAIYDGLSAEAAELLAQEQAAVQAAYASTALQTVADAGNYMPDSFQEPVYNESTGNYIVDNAYSKIGAPYEWAACGPDSFDCSGFVSYCILGGPGRLGSSSTMEGWTPVGDPQPGDVCVRSGHVGIYIGGGMMIHAPQEGETVCIAPVQSGMHFVRYTY